VILDLLLIIIAKMEEILPRHLKEQRELQARMTQKRKSATKKTRKGVNDECEALERELKEQQQAELAALLDTHNGPGEEMAQTSHDNFDVPQASTTSEAQDGQNHDRIADNFSLSLNNLNLNGAPSTQPRKPNRQKARLARRAAERDTLAHQAAEEATSLPDLKRREREIMLEQFRKQDLKEEEVQADGHCLYAAVADGLQCQGLELRRIIASVSGNQDQTIEDFRVVRQTAAKYIEEHEDMFTPFLEEPLEDYVNKIRDTGEWGGQLELLALAKAYNVDISVLQVDGESVNIEGDGSEDKRKKLFLAYYKHNFGLGEHYNSLRKKT